jgi:hypothetical protein
MERPRHRQRLAERMGSLDPDRHWALLHTSTFPATRTWSVTTFANVRARADQLEHKRDGGAAELDDQQAAYEQ